MSEAERVVAHAMLRAAGYTVSQAAWMAASCPSIQRCRDLCSHRKRFSEPVFGSTPLSVAIREAHDALRLLRGTAQEADAMARLQAAIDAFYEARKAA